MIVLAALTLVELWLLHRSNAPLSIAKRAQVLLAVMVAQGFVGYTQYFSHEPSLLVGVHVAGAVSVWLAMLWFYDGLSHHPTETVTSAEPTLAADMQPQDLAGLAS